MLEKQRINIDIDKTLWKKVGIKAVENDMKKREVVERALSEYIEKNKKGEC